MRHNHKNKILKREEGMRRALLLALSKSLIACGKIETTEAKAKAIRPMVERLITYAKTGDLANRRKIVAMLGPAMTKKLFERAAGKYSSRNGGYTRIYKKGTRAGDNARMALIELV